MTSMMHSLFFIHISPFNLSESYAVGETIVTEMLFLLLFFSVYPSAASSISGTLSLAALRNINILLLLLNILFIDSCSCPGMPSWAGAAKRPTARIGRVVPKPWAVPKPRT